jgi:hypothetical protein
LAAELVAVDGLGGAAGDRLLEGFLGVRRLSRGELELT